MFIRYCPGYGFKRKQDKYTYKHEIDDFIYMVNFQLQELELSIVNRWYFLFDSVTCLGP